MTFRPTDDVLDSMENSQQGLGVSNQYNQTSSESISDDLNGWNWSRIFSNPDAEDDTWNVVWGVDMVWKSQIEEVKSPDLSELLGKNEVDESENKTQSSDNNVVESDSGDFTVDLSEIEKSKWEKPWDWQFDGQETVSGADSWLESDDELSYSGKMPDRKEKILFLELNDLSMVKWTFWLMASGNL